MLMSWYELDTELVKPWWCYSGLAGSLTIAPLHGIHEFYSYLTCYNLGIVATIFDSM